MVKALWPRKSNPIIASTLVPKACSAKPQSHYGRGANSHGKDRRLVSESRLVERRQSVDCFGMVPFKMGRSGERGIV